MPQVRTLTPDGDEIRALRLKLGLTPEQLSEKLRRHPQTIRQLENGRITRASEILMHQLARALQARAEDITKPGAAA